MLPKLYVITDRAQAHAPLEATLEACFEAGARLVQLREKDLPRDELRRLAERLVPLARDHEAKLLINTHADIAHTTGAHGVHRPATGEPVDRLRQAMGPRALVGVSTHSLAEAKAARDQGADFVTLSPIFASKSKPGYGPALGLDGLAGVCEAVDLPVYALAGVTPDRAAACVRAGAYGVAVMGGIMRAARPAAAVEAYLRAM